MSKKRWKTPPSTAQAPPTPIEVPDQPLWCNPEEIPTREVETDSRPLLSGKCLSKRRYRRLPLLLDYPTVHNAAKTIRALGKGSLLTKIDLKNAYRVMPSGSPPSCREMGGQSANRWSPAIRSEISPKTIHRHCRYSHVDHGTEGCHPHTTLPGQFFVPGKTRLHRMCPQLGNSIRSMLRIKCSSRPPESTRPQHLPVLPRDHNRLCVRPAAVRDSKLAKKEKMHEKRAPVAIRPAKPRRFSYRSGQDLHERLDRPPQASHRPSPLHSPQLIRQSGHHWWATFMESWNGFSYLPGKPPLIHMFSDASWAHGVQGPYGAVIGYSSSGRHSGYQRTLLPKS